MKYLRLLFVPCFLVVFMTTLIPNAFALISTNPLLFSDCVSDGHDCCYPACRVSISACCSRNACGLPYAPEKTGGIVLGKLGFKGLALYCSSITTSITKSNEQEEENLSNDR